MGATLSKLSSVTSRNSLRSDFPNTVPSSMPSPMSLPQSSPIRSILFHQSRSGPLSHEKPITRVDVGFDVLRRDQAHRMAKRGQFAGPMVSATAGFHGDLRRRQLGEKGDHLRAAEIDPQHRPVLLIDAM